MPRNGDDISVGRWCGVPGQRRVVVAIQLAGTDLAAIREDEQCRTIPALLQALEELIEVNHLSRSVGECQFSPSYRSELKVGGEAEMIAG